MVPINLFVDRMENGSSLLCSNTLTPWVERIAHKSIDTPCVWWVRGRDESFRMVYRFGKHVRCACCKILLIYDYLLHILVYATAMAAKLRTVVAGMPNDAIRFRMEKKAISVTENLNATTQMHNEYIGNTFGVMPGCWQPLQSSRSSASLSLPTFMSHFWLHDPQL